MSRETVVRLGVDASGYVLELARAGKSAVAWAATNTAAGRRIEAAQRAVKEATEHSSAASTRAMTGFMRSLTQEASTASRTRDEMLRLRAVTLGISAEAEPNMRRVADARGVMANGANRTHVVGAGSDSINGAAGVGVQRIGGLADGVSKLVAIESAAYRAVQSLVGVQAEVDKVAVGLNFVNGGDVVAAGRDMEFLRETSSRLGLNLSTTTDEFMKLAATSRDTALEGQRTKDIFTAISEASTVLHLSGAQTSGALTSIQQMMSRGTIQSEDLRGQLAERLPGAFQIAARAMGVTTEVFGKMLEQGEVITTDFLPKFAAQIRKEFGGAVEEAAQSAQSSLGRSATAWSDLHQTVVDAGLGEFAAGQLNILTDGINSATEAMWRARREGAGFWGQMFAGAGAVARFLNPRNAFSYGPEADANRKKALEAQLAKNEPLAATDQIAAYRVRRTKAELLVVNSRSTRAVGSGDFTALEAEVARYEERDRRAMEGRVKAFVDGGRRKTARERHNANIEEVDLQFKAAVAGVEKGSELYAQAVAMANGRKAELADKYRQSDVKATGDAANKAERPGQDSEFETSTQQYRAKEDALRTHLINIRSQQQLGVISAREALDQERDARVNALTQQAALTKREIDLSTSSGQLEKKLRLKGELDSVNTQIQEAYDAHVRGMGELNRRETVQVKAHAESLKTALNSRRDAMRLDAAGAGMGDRGRDEMRRIADVHREVESKKSEISQSRSDNRISEEVYQQQLASLEGYLITRVQLERDATAQISAAEADWRSGASRGIATYIEQAQNAAGATASIVGRLFGGMEDWAVRFAMTGQASIKDFADTFIAEIVRMQVRTAAAGFLHWASVAIGGALGFADKGGAGPPTSAINTATPSPTMLAAHGYAFNAGRVAAHARGSTFTNAIVSTPTTFAMADGRGMMGEAGPEGIFPLVRTSSGDLGVRAIGMGGQTVGVKIEVINNGQPVNARASTTQAPDGSQLVQIFLDAVGESIAQGAGPVPRAMEQRYGLARSMGF